MHRIGLMREPNVWRAVGRDFLAVKGELGILGPRLVVSVGVTAFKVSQF